MKTLTLLRHAKSSWDDPVGRDFDRPLNDRGRRAARTIGRELHAQGMDFDRVIASPAVRVVETLAEAGEAYGRDFAPEYDPVLYLAGPATLLERVQAVDSSVERLLLVGHNPGLEQFALWLIADDGAALRRELAVKYPTATVAQISLDVAHWAEVAEATGALTRFIRPRDLDPELGPEE